MVEVALYVRHLDVVRDVVVDGEVGEERHGRVRDGDVVDGACVVIWCSVGGSD